MSAKVSVSWKRRQKPPEEASERALAWLGRFVILTSFPVAALEETLFGFPALAIMMLVLYASYVVFWWKALGPRRPEMAALAVIAVALTVLYVAAVVGLWGNGPDTGFTVEQW